MSERRPYIRPMPSHWWAHKPYLAYTVRELTGVAVGLYGLVLLIGLIELCAGPQAFAGYMQALASPWMLLLHLVLLVAIVWHVITWFQTLPKTMPKLILGDRPVPQDRITRVALIVGGVCSLVLLVIAFGSFRS